MEATSERTRVRVPRINEPYVDKSKPIPHYNPVRFIVGNHKGGDKVFLSGNDKVLNKLLQNFVKST